MAKAAKKRTKSEKKVKTLGGSGDVKKGATSRSGVVNIRPGKSRIPPKKKKKRK